MKLLIVSTAPFIYKDNSIYAYSPYVNEMAIWHKYSDEIAFCCPVWKNENNLLVSKLPFAIKRNFELTDFNTKTLANVLSAFFNSFYNIFILFKAMLWADHIHLRCPGNIGLLGAFVQILFPCKTKTAKYAGNWDPDFPKPWSYRLQQWILGNTFLTKKIQVLVYGEWKGSSKNIKPFFTATYTEMEKLPLFNKNLNELIHFVFVGALVEGKNPLYAIQLVETLAQKGYNVHLSLYGEGTERNWLEEYISERQLEKIISLYGNQSQETVKNAYQNSHFVILPSESEGWPKAIAEGMFWGCVPVATSVSCVPFMLDYGKRGVLLKMNLEKDSLQMEALLQNEEEYDKKRKLASDWSRIFTLDVFEEEIKMLMV